MTNPKRKSDEASRNKVSEEWSSAFPKNTINWQYVYIWECKEFEDSSSCKRNHGKTFLVRVWQAGYKPYNGILECEFVNSEAWKFHLYEPLRIKYRMEQYNDNGEWVAPTQYMINGDR